MSTTSPSRPPAIHERYSAVAAALHWAIAALILFNLITGTFMESLKGVPKHIVVSMHSSAGLTVLLLTLARIAWRLGHKPPPFSEGLTLLERRAAQAVHGLFYILMIVMPLIGWSISSASTRKGGGTEFYFLMPTPKIGFLNALPIPQKTVIHDQAVLAHTIGAWIMLTLLIVHVAGALKHQFVDGQPQFKRMWFARTQGGAELVTSKLKA